MALTNETVVAEKLLQVEAVKLNIEKPYTWASGWKSPIYCDNRKLLSYPFVRDFIKSELCNVVFEKYPDAEAIAGVATAGIPWGAMVADQLKLPFMYVRANAKSHGLGNQIEGVFHKNEKVVMIEDLISTGLSSLESVKVLLSNNVYVMSVISIFSYGFIAAIDAFKNAGIPFYSLTNYNALIELAEAKSYINSSQIETLLSWREQPEIWMQ